MNKEQLQRSRQLGQLAPVNTDAFAVYSPAAGVIGEVTLIVIANTGSGAVDYRIFHDKDGATYAVGNALFYDITLAATTSTVIDLGESGIAVDGTLNGSIGIRSNTADDLTVTLYGWEISK